MHYGLTLSLITLALAGCSATPSPPTPADNTYAAAAPRNQVLHFVGPMDLTIQLQTSDNFETAVLSDDADRRFLLKATPAASGIRMTDGKNTTIHFKSGEGIVEFVPGKPIAIKEFKK